MFVVCRARATISMTDDDTDHDGLEHHDVVEEEAKAAVTGMSVDGVYRLGLTGAGGAEGRREVVTGRGRRAT